MRRFIRPATPEEEALIASHLAPGDSLLGVHGVQNMYAIRESNGALRFVDYDSVKPPQPSFFERIRKLFA